MFALFFENLQHIFPKFSNLFIKMQIFGNKICIIPKLTIPLQPKSVSTQICRLQVGQ